jgi:hypothetical protein
MAKKIRVWDGSAWQDVAPSLPYTAIHSAQASMPSTGVDGQVWLDTDGTLADTGFVPLSGGTMTGNLNTPSINSGGITGRNYFINGSFDIWQRGTDITTTGYSADRWILDWVNTGYTAGISGRLVRSADAPAGMLYSASCYSTQATGFMLIQQPIESLNAAELAGKVVTLSFYIKRVAAISGGVLSIRYDNGGVSQDGFSGSLRDYNGADILNDLSTIPTSWTRYSSTFTVPSGATNGLRAGVYLRNITGVTTSGQEVVKIAGIKLEIGNTATPFSRAKEDIQGELAACQRYYYKLNASQGSSYAVLGTGFATNTTTGAIVINFPVTLRVKPSAIDYGGSIRIHDETNAYAVSSYTYDANTASTDNIRILVNSSGLTAYRPLFLGGNSSTAAYLAFSAEL